MIYSQFSRNVVLCSLLSLTLITACKTSQKTVKNNSINLDTLTIKAGKEKPVYHGSETRINDIIHTKLEVKFNWAKQYMYGKAVITAKPYFYGTNKISLNARGMDINEVALLKGDIKTKLDYIYKDEVLQITLNKEYTRNDTFKLYIDYIAKPNELKVKGGSEAIKDDKGLYFINPEGKEKDKPQQIWTQGETQSNSVWFPCVDSPNEKMTDEIYITIDKKYTTLSNGALTDQKENTDGTRTDHWKMDLPHSTYLVMMAIGEFSVVKDKWRDKEVSYYLEKEFEPYAKDIFGHTPEMIEAFSTKLGVPFAWNKYSQIIVRDYVSGAMENTTATLHGDFLNQTDREMLDHDYEDVISHELFHQWFGDLVTCESWSNLPVNESFADYGEYIWEEYKYGRDAADAHFRDDLNKYLKEAKRKQVDIVRYYYADREEVFDRHTYEKGGCVLHMLRKYVGDDAFYASLKLYLETNKFGNAEIASLRMAFEKITGEDLNWFFNQWFFASGHPDLLINHHYNSAAQKYEVTIEQKQDLKTTPLYKLPVDVDIYTSGTKERKRIVIEKQKQTFEFDAPSKPNLVNVDAEKMLLCVKEETGKTPAELAFQYHHAPLYEDRSEALFALVKSPKSDEYIECILNALDDSYWEIRLLGISGLTEILEGNKEASKAGLIRIAAKDPKSLVRAEAINFLSQNFKDKSLISLYKQALNDRSYTVMGDALSAIDKLDSSQSVVIAKTLEGEKNEQILAAIMDIYARNGTDENNDFFIKIADVFTGYWKISYASVYGDFLKRASDESINKALPVFESIAKDENKFVKLYGKRTLKDLVTMYEEKEKKLSAKLKEAKSTEQASINTHLEKIRAQKKKINELLDSLEEKK
jgi:aminopeptidase N